MIWKRCVSLAARGCIGVLSACSVYPTVADRPPSFSNVVATANPYNALSIAVGFHSNADSARIICATDGDSLQVTPYYALTDTSAKIVVLGLRPSRTYSCAVEAVGHGTTSRSAQVQVDTGTLPSFLQGVHVVITAGTPTAGYDLTAVSDGDSVGYVVAFDQIGNVAWYREFDYGVPPRETKQQANGNFTVFLGSSVGGTAAYGWYFEFAPDGTIVRKYTANPPYYTDLHELVLTFSDTSVDKALFFGYDIRPLDLTSIGGPANAMIAGHSLLRQTVSGEVDFFWSAWDHFTLQDWIEEPASLKQASTGDFDHPNSLDIDHDGNYLVSWRNFAEVTKIDSRNGSIIWRLGGAHNQFTFVSDPLSGFSGQHCVRVLDNGDLLLYDNGWRHTPSESRAAEYALDVSGMTATLVWEFRHNPPIFTGFAGSVQRLSNGNTFIGWAYASTMTEVSANGTVVWEGQLTAGGQLALFYRALKIPSLYKYERP